MIFILNKLYKFLPPNRNKKKKKSFFNSRIPDRF